MVTEVTMDIDVNVTSRREEYQRIQVECSSISYIIMPMSFMFIVVTGRKNYIYTDEGELVDNLFTGQRKEDSDYLMKSEYLLEPKDLLPTQCWKTWLKGLFKMRTLPKFCNLGLYCNPTEKQQEGSSWT